jgi:hypothetical protein
MQPQQKLKEYKRKKRLKLKECKMSEKHRLPQLLLKRKANKQQLTNSLQNSQLKRSLIKKLLN